MASSVAANPPAYSCVLVLGGHFAAVHVNGTNKRFLSEHPTKEYRTAAAAAEAFANLNKIPFKRELQLLDRPVITIFETESGWLPGKIDTNELSVFSPPPCPPSPGTKEAAIEAAKSIAEKMSCDFVPSLGTLLSQPGE